MTTALAALGVAEFAKAVELAGAAHAGQRTAVGDPYILHPTRVALAMRADGYDYLHQTVAVLHDVVEDTGVRLDHIRSWFGPEVARAVYALTKRDDESYPDFVARAADDPVAAWVKLYDIRDNAGRLDDLLPDHPELEARLRTKYQMALAQLAERGIR